MQTLVVGQPFPGAYPPLQEGVELYLSGSCPEIRLVLSKISKQEVKHFRKGKLRFSVYAPEDLPEQLFLCLKIDGFAPGWFDMSYHRALEENYFGRKVELPALESFNDPQLGLAMLITLVQAEDAMLAGMRLVALPNRLSVALVKRVTQQPSRISPEYFQVVDFITDTYKPDDLAAQGLQQ